MSDECKKILVSKIPDFNPHWNDEMKKRWWNLYWKVSEIIFSDGHQPEYQI